jgi:FAD binding domain
LTICLLKDILYSQYTLSDEMGPGVSTLKEVPVLVVGAGPAGLTAAIALGRYGVECLLIERRLEPSTHPRATVVSTRTMELLRWWGLEEPVLAGGVEVEWLMWVCETLARAGEGTAVEVGLPTRAQAAPISPTARRARRSTISRGCCSSTYARLSPRGSNSGQRWSASRAGRTVLARRSVTWRAGNGS